MLSNETFWQMCVLYKQHYQTSNITGVGLPLALKNRVNNAERVIQHPDLTHPMRNPQLGNIGVPSCVCFRNSCENKLNVVFYFIYLKPRDQWTFSPCSF